MYNLSYLNARLSLKFKSMVFENLFFHVFVFDNKGGGKLRTMSSVRAKANSCWAAMVMAVMAGCRRMSTRLASTKVAEAH